MKVLYIHQYYRKPKDGGAIRSFYLSQALADSGTEVDIITSHNNPNYRVELIDGVRVHFLPVKYDNRYSYFRRKISFISFFIKAYFFAARKFKDVDISYITSTPLTVGITGILLKKLHKIPFIFEVRDLWPEAPIQMGAIKNPIAKWLLRGIERYIYKQADKIVALSPGMKAGVLSYGNVPEEKVSVLPNISDCEYFGIENKAVKNTFYYGVGEKFVISYFGAIGKVNNIEFILDVAEECKKQGLNDIMFLIAGKGSELRRIRSKHQQLELNNVRLLGFQNRAEIKKMLNVTDASIITFRNKSILETNSPNKFFDSIAAGKLCIVNNKGWIKDLIEENNCGFYVNPKVTLDFVAKIKPYLEDKALLKQTQLNARKLAESSFSRTKITKEFTDLFDLPHLLEKQLKSQASNTNSKARA